MLQEAADIKCIRSMLRISKLEYKRSSPRYKDECEIERRQHKIGKGGYILVQRHDENEAERGFLR